MPLTLAIPLAEYFRITLVQKTALSRLGLTTIRDLLYHFPVRYGDTAEARSIDTLTKGEMAVIYGTISKLEASKGFRSQMTMATGTVEDETGHIQCVWFNQPYIAKITKEGALVRIEGKVSERRKKGSGSLYFSNPKIETVNSVPIGVGDSLFGNGNEAHSLYPVYPESRGTSSLWIYHAIQKIFKNGLLDTIPEPIPADILKKYSLPGIKTALIWIHAPLKRDDALSARKRFAFEEIFLIQLGRQKARAAYAACPPAELEIDTGHVHEFVRRFPFTATGAQTRAINAIVGDMTGGKAMSRLLEGDVGSGKTAVAATAAYAVIASRNAQVAYMCPTEILAAQHFESFIQYFSYMPVQIGLITGSGCRKFPSRVNPKGWTDISRAQLLKWVADGSIAVLVGTHALIRQSVVFKNLVLAIIDEQHRFGTAQRSKLVRRSVATGETRVKEPFRSRGVQEHMNETKLTDEKRRPLGRAPLSSKGSIVVPEPVSHLSPLPHLLTMTATPIPRTLALTMYGDLDLTVLDEQPAGRKQIITDLVTPGRRAEIYEHIRRELRAGRQMYVICPRIDEPDPDKQAAVTAKSVKEEAKRLKQSVFPEYEIGILHSKMSPKEKDSVMSAFKAGKTDILCATSVVEVGVNVPNATVIVIEGAERFGLAQLHQLRGRVLRSSEQAYCYAFTETSSAKSIERLKALQSARNGFELAELDLSLRGAGQLSGARQWGISDLAMEALRNLKMVEAARTEAVRLVRSDATLVDYPILKEQVETRGHTDHFE